MIGGKFIVRWHKFLLTKSYYRSLWYKSYNCKALVFSDVSNNSYIIPTGDEAIGFHLYVGGKYDSELVGSVVEKLGIDFERKLFVDVGSNVGHICIPAVKDYGFRKAIAVEPGNLNFRLLNSNCFINNLSNKIDTKNVALGDQKTKSVFLGLCNENIGDHQVLTCPSESKRVLEQIELETLDNLVPPEATSTNTLIWIDVQGFEGFVFSGAQKVINRKIPICFEFWPDGLIAKKNYEKLVEVLISSKYSRLINMQTGQEYDVINSQLFEYFKSQLITKNKHIDLLVI